MIRKCIPGTGGIVTNALYSSFDGTMALKSTIFKIDLHITDLERHYYGEHNLTIARHPSENDERMMVRILTFALFASDHLTFGRGLSTAGEPDLWEKDLTDAVELWIEVGEPDEKEIRRACGKARNVAVVTYGKNSVIWWKRHGTELQRQRNLRVLELSYDGLRKLASIVDRNMGLHCTIEAGSLLVAVEGETVELSVKTLHG